MPVPNLSGVLRGWTKVRTVKTVIKTVVDHRVVETPTSISVAMMLVPMPAQTVNRKPTEQRSWKWWSVSTQASETALGIDDIIVEGSKQFRIVEIGDWSEGGVRKYGAVEGYTGGT